MRCHVDASTQVMEIGEIKKSSIFGSSHKFMVKLDDKILKEFIDNLKNLVEITGT